jgi:hypothetical protein
MKRTLAIILAVVALGVIAVTGYYFGYDNGWETAHQERDAAEREQAQQQVNDRLGSPSPTPVPQPTTGAFHQDANGDYWGTLILAGYLDVQRRACNPGDMCGNTVDYAYFVFGNTDNDAIKKFAGVNDGNFFVAGDRVGIGCRQKDPSRIYYENFADTGEVTGEISGDDYAKLVSSSQGHPVQVRMTRELYTSGRGAPDCYSHFRSFDIL